MNKILKDLLVGIKTIGAKQDEATAVAEVDAFIAAQTNANEIMNTGATGAGKELIPINVLQPEVLDLVPQYSYLLPLLPSNHGTNMAVSEKVAVLGEADMYSGNTEWTTGAAYPNTPTGKKVATGEITITQGQFILEIALSKRELNYAIVDLEATVKTKMNMAAARTIDAFILNADTATSGNVNLDGGTPASTIYYLQGNNGLRKLGLTNSVDIGAFDDVDVLSMIDALGDYASDPSMLLLAVNRKVYNKMLGFTNVKTYDKAYTNLTIQKGVLANIYGVDILVHRDVPALAQATGLVSSTGGSNTTGTIVLFYKPAVQYGWGQVDEFEVTRVAGKGVVLTSTFEFGFTIPNGEAGYAPMVSTGKNITM